MVELREMGKEEKKRRLRPARRFRHELAYLASALVLPAAIAAVFPYAALKVRPCERAVQSEPACIFARIDATSAEAALSKSRTVFSQPRDGDMPLRADLSAPTFGDLPLKPVVDASSRSHPGPMPEFRRAIMLLPPSLASPEIPEFPEPEAAAPVPPFTREELLKPMDTQGGEE